MSVDGVIALAAFAALGIGIGLVRRGRRATGFTILVTATLSTVVVAILYDAVILPVVVGSLMVVLAADVERRSRAAGLAMLACGFGIAFVSVLIARLPAALG